MEPKWEIRLIRAKLALLGRAGRQSSGRQGKQSCEFRRRKYRLAQNPSKQWSKVRVDELKIALITLAGVVLTAFATWSIAQRRIAAQHVIAERAKWRNDIRTKALLVHDAMLRGETATVARLKIDLAARLNPFDRHDQELLKCMVVKDSDKARQCAACEFARRISLLLKHDWDRAKLEASVFVWRWFLDVRRWGLDWDDHKSGEDNFRGGLELCARKRRAHKVLWLCEKYKLRKYKLRWGRAAFTLTVLVAAWCFTKLGELVTTHVLVI